MTESSKAVVPERLDGRGCPMPLNGWDCFHCGDNFQTWGAARDHFGETPEDTAACKIKVGDERGLVMELRKVQYELTVAREQIQTLTDALEMIYDKYEDGDPCTENGDEHGSPIGNAVRLSAEEEDLILSLIPKQRGVK